MNSMLVTLSVEIQELGKRIKQARVASGLSPTEVAAMAGMSTANLYRIESEDTKSIPRETLQRLAAALKVDFDSDVKTAMVQEALH